MDARTTLTLGQFKFASFEVPSEINFGGSQRLSVHELIGGVRVIDAMGRADAPLTWSGILTGADAPNRGRYLDGLRILGQPQTLSWGVFRYSVLVRDFAASYQQAFQIPYRITCEVLADLTTPEIDAGATPVDQAMADDAAAATTLAGKVGDGALTSAMATLNSAIKSVSSFAKAAQSQINGVLGPLQAAQNRVQTLIAQTSNAVATVTTFGGLVPGNPVAQAASRLSGQVVAVTQLGNLIGVRNTLGRMAANLLSLKAPQRTVTVAGGNLFKVAQQQYGDQTAWAGIAQANGRTDPFITGPTTLTIPPQPAKTGGVLGA